MSQPRNTATIGFTYAYVATFAVGTWFSNHTYAVNPISDPATTRYAMALSPRIVQTTVCWSPRASEMPKLTKPAQSISHPVAENGSTVRSQRRDKIEPSAQLSEANIRIPAPNSTPCPPAPACSFGHNSTSRPTIPVSNPSTPRRSSRSPFKIQVSMIATHSGTTATMSAASPLGTVFSAHATH